MPVGKEMGGGRKGGSTTKKNAFCSFCRKSYRDVGPLVEGPGDVYICGECIDLCQSILEQEQRRRRGPTKPLFNRIPHPANRRFSSTSMWSVRPQPRRFSAVAVHNHYKRLQLGFEGSDVEMEKSNILLAGSHGLGQDVARSHSGPRCSTYRLPSEMRPR
jgi:ATP-dependent Clp protease ATP-binding subunit ClpX